VAIQTADLKFEGSASVPDKNGNSLTAVRLQLVENGATRQLKEMSMLAIWAKHRHLTSLCPRRTLASWFGRSA
jgi:hypothetical protein